MLHDFSEVWLTEAKISEKRGRVDSLLKIKQNGRTNENLDTIYSNENPLSLATEHHLVPRYCSK